MFTQMPIQTINQGGIGDIYLRVKETIEQIKPSVAHHHNSHKIDKDLYPLSPSNSSKINLAPKYLKKV